jgi:transposase
LHSFLSSCADNGGQAPLDLSPFLPWEMDEERKQKLSCPMPTGRHTTTIPPSFSFDSS